MQCPRSRAWGPGGHWRALSISRDLLTESEKEQVHDMLGGRMMVHDISELGRWEKEMTAKHPETESLHWHRQDPEWTCSRMQNQLGHIGDAAGQVRCDGHGAAGGSLFCALAYFFDHFAHDALLQEFPQSKEPIGTPTWLQALSKLPPQTSQNELRWLAILIGDIHQPLHWLRTYDYGRKIQVVYQNENHTLLSFWEDVLPKHLPVMPSYEASRQLYEQRAPPWWEKRPTELFRDWAREAADVVCHQVYAAIEVQLDDGTRGVDLDTPVMLNEELFQRWLHLANDLTTLAGHRIAFILRDILEHKRHSAASKEGRGRHRSHHRIRHGWAWNLAVNVCISVVIVPSILACLRLHDRAGGMHFFRAGAGHMTIVEKLKS